MALTKAMKDAAIRQYGLDRINLDGMIQVAGGTFLASCVYEGVERFYEISVVAKSDKFTQADVDALLVERAATEERKAERAKIAEDKRIAAAEKKAKAKAATP